LDALEWSGPLSRAYHEAGHVVAAHIQGFEASSATISDDKGLGATIVDTLDNHEATAVMAFAGLASQILFDDSLNVTDEWWLIDRLGRTLDDEELAREAIKKLLGEVEFTTKLAQSNQLRDVAHEMVSSERAQLLIARVAEALNEQVSLNGEQLHDLLYDI
jgi:hypothetical protein